MIWTSSSIPCLQTISPLGKHRKGMCYTGGMSMNNYVVTWLNHTNTHAPILKSPESIGVVSFCIIWRFVILFRVSCLIILYKRKHTFFHLPHCLFPSLPPSLPPREGTKWVVQYGAIDHMPSYCWSRGVVVLFFSNCTTHVVPPLLPTLSHPPSFPPFLSLGLPLKCTHIACLLLPAVFAGFLMHSTCDVYKKKKEKEEKKVVIYILQLMYYCT